MKNTNEYIHFGSGMLYRDPMGKIIRITSAIHDNAMFQFVINPDHHYYNTDYDVSGEAIYDNNKDTYSHVNGITYEFKTNSWYAHSLEQLTKEETQYIENFFELTVPIRFSKNLKSILPKPKQDFREYFADRYKRGKCSWNGKGKWNHKIYGYNTIYVDGKRYDLNGDERYVIEQYLNRMDYYNKRIKLAEHTDR